MEPGTSTAADHATEAETMAAMVLEAAERHGSATALRYHGEYRWADISYEELGATVREIARGLIALGIEAGDKVAILSDTRPEWTLADFGILCAGAISVPVYQTASEEECEHVLSDSGARAVFCEDRDQLAKVQAVRENTSVERVILFEGAPPEEDEDEQDEDEQDEGEQEEDEPSELSLAKLRKKGEEVDDGQVDERVEGISADDVFTLIYTSGTTGPPKGCVLTHGNYKANCRMIEEVADLGEDPVFYVFLPLAHALTRITQMLSIDVGATIGYWQRDKEKLLEDLQALKPTHFPAVPRIFEKIYNQARAKADNTLKEKMLDKALEVGREYRDLERRGEEPGPVLKREFQAADKALFSSVRDLFGGNLRFALTGAAPVAAEMLEFFYACGVLVLEGYGATETSAATASNRPGDFKFGTVGKALPGCEIKIGEKKKDEDDDEEDGEDDGSGEILVKGPHVFQGYFGMEEETSEVLEDGWFHTEDIGSLDEDGFLTISGREKDIIVTSSGKNITPTQIENKLTDSALISQAVVYGDEREYLTALITLDEEEVSGDPAELAEDDETRQKVQKIVDEVNEDFASIEQVKKFAILDRDLSQDEGELTATMKVKRQKVYENHQELFDSLYDGDDEDDSGDGDDDDAGDGDDG